MKTILKILFLLIPLVGFSQVGIGTTSPDTNTVLDVSSENKGVKIPCISKKKIQAKFPNPTSGLIVYVPDAIEIGQWFPINGQWFWYIYETRGAIWVFDGIEWGEMLVVVKQ